MNIIDLDWKSLMLLEALITEGRVSKVAVKYAMSQPAVSNTLARLRDSFQDPLLLRTRQGMLPTPYAKQLLHAIKQARHALEPSLKRETTFNPATSEEHFTIAATDYAEWMISPRLVQSLAREAPGVQVEIVPLKERVPFRDLESGEVDLAIGYFHESQASLYQQLLFSEDFVCLLPKEGKRKKSALTVEEYAGLRHILVAPWGGLTGIVDSVLAKRGLNRVVAVSTPHFLMAPWLVSEAGYAVTLPRCVAARYAHLLSLEIQELPFKLPALPFRQLWHEQAHQDPGQRWLRARIASLSDLK